MKFEQDNPRLLPHDESFYAFFTEASQNLVNAVALLKHTAHNRD